MDYLAAVAAGAVPAIVRLAEGGARTRCISRRGGRARLSLPHHARGGCRARRDLVAAELAAPGCGLTVSDADGRSSCANPARGDRLRSQRHPRNSNAAGCCRSRATTQGGWMRDADVVEGIALEQQVRKVLRRSAGGVPASCTPRVAVAMPAGSIARDQPTSSRPRMIRARAGRSSTPSPVEHHHRGGCGSRDQEYYRARAEHEPDGAPGQLQLLPEMHHRRHATHGGEVAVIAIMNAGASRPARRADGMRDVRAPSVWPRARRWGRGLAVPVTARRGRHATTLSEARLARAVI